MKDNQFSRETLTSTKNLKIKNFAQLLKARERRSQGLFVVEGRKELKRAIQAGYKVDHLFYCKEIIAGKDLEDLLQHLSNVSGIYEVSVEVYNHIAYREGAEGVIAWVEEKVVGLDEIILSKNPIILVLESVEKPGNLGAILRTTDAAGIDAVIVCDPTTDIYNPNVVRSSIGGLFSNTVIATTSERVIEWLNQHGINIYCTALTASKSYLDIDYTQPTAIVMGTEATGLSDRWLKVSQQNIIIPMEGEVDSLNVSVSSGIVLFEAIRQRNLKK